MSQELISLFNKKVKLKTLDFKHTKFSLTGSTLYYIKADNYLIISSDFFHDKSKKVKLTITPLKISKYQVILLNKYTKIDKKLRDYYKKAIINKIDKFIFQFNKSLNNLSSSYESFKFNESQDEKSFDFNLIEKGEERDIFITFETSKKNPLIHLRIELYMLLDEEAVRIKLQEQRELEEKKEKERKAKLLKASVEKIKKMITVSTRIKLDMMREVLKMNRDLFNEMLFDWAKEFGFTIDGEYLIINKEKSQDFLDNINEYFKSPEENKSKEETLKEIECSYCGNLINYDVIICPFCGNKKKKKGR